MSYIAYPVKCDKCGKIVSTSHGVVGDTPIVEPIWDCECGGHYRSNFNNFNKETKMRELNIGTKEHTKVVVMDERGPGNANHKYEIQPVDPTKHFILGSIRFQNGPIQENGVNGIHNEDLIAIVIDRLEGFQAGDYAHEANASAIALLREALAILRSRTDERKARGVEGTSEV